MHIMRVLEFVLDSKKKLDNDVVRTKCFMCNREGFRSEKSKKIKVQGKGTEIVRPMKPNGVL